MTGTKYATVGLNVRTGASVSAALVTVLDAGSKVSVTATTDGQWALVVHQGKVRWVKGQYLATKKQEASSQTVGISSASCAGGSSVESGLTPDAIGVHRAICARFPQVKSFGGVRPDSLPEHPSGRALDAMISSPSVGWEIANWVRANARQLGVSEVIYSQKIWTVQRGTEGWRSMSDRGSVTANHYDHVHTTVYGNSGTG